MCFEEWDTVKEDRRDFLREDGRRASLFHLFRVTYKGDWKSQKKCEKWTKVNDHGRKIHKALWWEEQVIHGGG